MSTTEQITSEMECMRDSMRHLTASLTGGGTGELVNRETGSEITSTTRTGVGTHTVVFRRFYPELKRRPIFTFSGTLPFTGRCSAIDYTGNPPTATFVFSVGAFETDIPSTDIVDIDWIVRNSAKNG